MSRVVVTHETLGKRAAAHIGQQRSQLRAQMLVDQRVFRNERAELRGVGDRPPHALRPARIHEVRNLLHLVAALDVGNLGRIASLDQQREALVHQRHQPTTQHRLLAEEIAFGFGSETRLDESAARAADAGAPSDGHGARAACGVFAFHGEERGNPQSLLVTRTHRCARTLGGHQHHAQICPRRDESEPNGKAVHEANHRAGRQRILDPLRPRRRLRLIGKGDDRQIRPPRRLGKFHRLEALAARQLNFLRPRTPADHDA